MVRLDFDFDSDFDFDFDSPCLSFIDNRKNEFCSERIAVVEFNRIDTTGYIPYLLAIAFLIQDRSGRTFIHLRRELPFNNLHAKVPCNCLKA